MGTFYSTVNNDLTGEDGKTTDELQMPTGYTGIYTDWDVDIDNMKLL